MVLQSNFAKRANAENTPPSQHRLGKSLASRVRSSLHDTARRRRARTNGLPRTSKYVVEQARRRNHAILPSNKLRFHVTTIAPPPVTDIEMKDAEPSLKTTTVPVTLPKELGRPEYCEISQEAISAIAPELGDTDIGYLRETLEEFGPRYEILQRNPCDVVADFCAPECSTCLAV